MVKMRPLRLPAQIVERAAETPVVQMYDILKSPSILHGARIDYLFIFFKFNLDFFFINA